MAEKLRTAQELAKALGVSGARVSQLRKREWFPNPGPDGWDVDEVRSAIEENRRRYAPSADTKKALSTSAKKPTTTKSPASVPAPALSVEAEVEAEPDELLVGPLAVLADAKASTLDHARAARQVLASQFARAAARTSSGMGKVADELKKALEEQRRAEKAWLDLERQKGQLIQRSAAVRVAAELAKRAVTTMDTIEAQIASQIEVWLGDSDFVGGDPLQRQRKVISWFDRCCRRVREVNADIVEGMIAESQGDAAPDLEDEGEEDS